MLVWSAFMVQMIWRMLPIRSPAVFASEPSCSPFQRIFSTRNAISLRNFRALSPAPRSSCISLAMRTRSCSMACSCWKGFTLFAKSAEEINTEGHEEHHRDGRDREDPEPPSGPEGWRTTTPITAGAALNPTPFALACTSIR